MIVVDSSIWVDVMRKIDNPGTRKFRSIDPTGDIILGDVVLLEVLQGARDDLNALRIERELRQFNLRQMLDGDIAIHAAANYRRLRSLGKTIRKTNDLIIGTWCIENRCALLHNDCDFLPMVDHLGLVAL